MVAGATMAQFLHDLSGQIYSLELHHDEDLVVVVDVVMATMIFLFHDLSDCHDDCVFHCERFLHL